MQRVFFHKGLTIIKVGENSQVNKQISKRETGGGGEGGKGGVNQLLMRADQFEKSINKINLKRGVFMRFEPLNFGTCHTAVAEAHRHTDMPHGLIDIQYRIQSCFGT